MKDFAYIIQDELGIKKGDKVIVACEGAAEDEAIAALQTFFKENL